MVWILGAASTDASRCQDKTLSGQDYETDIG